MSTEKLKEMLKANKILNLYLFYGEEEYLIDKYYNDILNKLLGTDINGISNIKHEGRIEIEKLKELCMTMPFFSDKKVILLENTGFFKTAKSATSDIVEENDQEKNMENEKKAENEKKDKEKKDKEINEENSATEISSDIGTGVNINIGSGRNLKAGKTNKKNAVSGGSNKLLIELFGNIPEYTCLIFKEKEVDKRQKTIFEAIGKNGMEVNFERPKPLDLAKWIILIMKQKKRLIDLKTASFMIEYCEQDMNSLYHEMEKLHSYTVEGQAITEGHIALICLKSIKSRIFDLTDALIEKKADKAFILLEEMLSLREPFLKILFMISRCYRQSSEALLLQKEGKSAGEIASQLRLTPYIAGKILKQASKYGFERIKTAIKMCHETDASFKQGKINDINALYLLVGELAQL